MDHLLLQQLLPIGVLIAMDTSYDKITFVFYWRIRFTMFYYVSCRPEPTTENKEMCVCAMCYIIGQDILHFNCAVAFIFRIIQIAVLIINILKPLLFENSVKLFTELQHTLIRLNRFGMRCQTRITENPQSSVWFLQHITASWFIY